MANWSEVKLRLLDTRAKFQSEIERIDELLNAVGQLAELIPDGQAPQEFDVRLTVGVEPQKPVPSRARNVMSPGEISSFVRDTLIELGKPLKRSALVSELERRGLQLAGKDKAKNLGTILWRHKSQFVNLPSLGYWPSDVPLEGIFTPEL